MMTQAKHLHELLREDQEPFLLQNYIADRRLKLNPKAQFQPKRRRPMPDFSSSFPHNFCKSACFLSFHDSPDPTRSPLFPKSPCKSHPSPIFLHVPSRTAAVLLEAAVRIQTPPRRSSRGTHDAKAGFGLLGSVLRKLTHRSRSRKRFIDGGGAEQVAVRDILRWDSSVGHKQPPAAPPEEVSCDGRLSSAVWSESNEETSSSCSSGGSMDFGGFERLNGDFASSKKGFCESPFRFVSQRSPSSGRRTPEFRSPAASPSRRRDEKAAHHEEKNINKFNAGDEEEEEKEQCSPVSVLDAPFDDDFDAHEDNFDLECSYAIVQRTKQQLLQKLRRFEKLAELDPVELEKRMMEDGENDDDHDDCKPELDQRCNDDKECVASDRVESSGIFKLSFRHECQIPLDTKKLVWDLIEEERGEVDNAHDDEEVAKRVCERLESWKEVESNTIDMMVEMDFRRELEGWKKSQDQVGDVAMEIEHAIFGLLVEELSEEVVYFSR